VIKVALPNTSRIVFAYLFDVPIKGRLREPAALERGMKRREIVPCDPRSVRGRLREDEQRCRAEGGAETHGNDCR